MRRLINVNFWPRIVCLSILSLALVLFYNPALAADSSNQQRQVVASAAEYGYPPFSIVDDSEQASGFSVELLEAVLRVMGYGVSFRTGPWPEVKQWLADGEVQVLPLVGRTPEREAVYDFTFPYLSMHGTIVVRKGERQIAKLDDLHGRTVAVMAGDNAEEFVRRSQLGAEIVTTDSFESALLQLSQGNVDAVIIQKLLAQQLINKLGINDLQFVGAPLTEFVQAFCFAVPEGEAELLAILNEGLSIVFANGTFQALHTKWFAEIRQPHKSRLIIGGDMNYPPYEFLDENGQPTGFNVDLTRAIAKQLDLQISIELDDWSVVRSKFESGQIDAIHGMFYSVERDRQFDFSPSHSIVNHSIVTRKGSPPLSTLADLEGLSILVMEGDIMHDLASSIGYAQQLTTVASQEEALRRLAAGEHDCVLVARLPALYWIDKNGWDNLQVSTESVLSPEYCYAVMDGNGALLSAISDALISLKNTGQYRKIYSKWFGIYQQDENGLETFIIYAALLTLPVFLVLIFVAIWNRSLKRQVSIRTEELLAEVKERQTAEQHLATQEQKFRNLFEHVSDYALVLRPEQQDLIIVDLNESACQYHGYSREELLGQPLRILDSDVRDYEKNLAALSRLRLGESVRLEVVHRRKDGSEFPVEAVIRMIEIDGEELLYAIERDVSVRKQAEQAKAELEIQVRQKHKMEAVGILAGGMAHNFNNNLSIILGYLELAQLKSGASPEVVEFLDQAKTALLRSRELIKQIMIYSRQDKQVFQSVKPAQLIDETFSLLKSTLPSSVSFRQQIAADARELTIKADATRIQEALINLCNNAVQAMEERGDLVISLDHCAIEQVAIPDQYPAKTGAFLRIAVRDSGHGIPKRLQEKVFDPFFTTKPLHEGTGMGLATVRGVVEQHQGFIKIDSRVNKGTSVELYFPVAAAEPVEVTAEQTEPATGTEELLFIDDDVQLAQMGKAMLEEYGYQVTSLTDPLEALALLKENPERFELVLTDQTMPGLSGVELIKKIKQLRPDLPIILCTGYSSKVSTTDIEQLGVSAFCMKPLEMKVLAQTVRNCLAESA